MNLCTVCERIKQEEAGSLQTGVIDTPSKRLHSPHLSQGCCAGSPKDHFYPHLGFLENRFTQGVWWLDAGCDNGLSLCSRMMKRRARLLDALFF